MNYVQDDMIPVSIALAQAAKESGRGTSRFALEGNAILVNGRGRSRNSSFKERWR